MKLYNLELEIQNLEYYESKYELTEKGKKTLSEYRSIKQQLILPDVVESKPNEKAALKHAVDAIYFADNSDYLSGLYGVVRSLTGLDEPTEEYIKKLFKELNPE